MADEDATAVGRRVVLDVEAQHARFLRTDFQTGVYTLSDDLERHEATLRNPARDRRQLAIFERWLADLDGGVLTVAVNELPLLVEMMIANDDANEFDRVLRHHSAYEHVLMQAFAPRTLRGRLARWWSRLVGAALRGPA